MKIPFQHKLVYGDSAQDKISVTDVANSLIANEQLVLEASKLLEKLFPSLEIDRVKVKFKSVSINSPLEETLWLTLYANYQEDLEKDVPVLIEDITGVEIPDKYDTLITILVILIAVYSIKYISKKIFEKDDKQKSPSIEISGNYNKVLIESSEITGIDVKDVEKTLINSYSDKENLSLAKKSLELIAPAKKSGVGNLSGGGVEISEETIMSAPHDFEFEALEVEEALEEIEDIELVIHANDMDSAKKGWGAHIPSISSRRIRMQISPEIRLSKIYGKRKINGRIILQSKVDKKGEMKPYLIHLLELNEDDD
ncbi:MAG: hypothetical protein OCD03_05605 [Hyphomicrobiales bacterium]